MKNYFWLPVVMLFIISCGSNDKQNKKDAVTKNDTATTSQQTEASKNNFTILSFDKNNPAFKDSIKGKLIDGFSWKDADGESTVVFSQTEVQMSKSGEQSQAIFANCYLKDGSYWKKRWSVQDRVDACPVDAICEFFPASFTVTDEDKNNIGEITFLYKLACKGDVSPDSKKLIMYEGGSKYAIRGSTILQFETGKEGGDKKVDASFNKAAKALLDYANAQWDKFGLVKF
jgi:hypothetical protein